MLSGRRKGLREALREGAAWEGGLRGGKGRVGLNPLEAWRGRGEGGVTRGAGPTFTGITSAARPPSHRDSRWPLAGGIGLGWPGGGSRDSGARGGHGAGAKKKTLIGG